VAEVTILKAQLTDWWAREKGYPCRVIAIESKASLEDLALAINRSFDFDFDHAYGFYDDLKDPYGAEERYELFSDLERENPDETQDAPEEPAVDSGHQGVKTVTVAEVFTEGRRLLYLFDYGDEWRFIVTFMRRQQETDLVGYPKVLEGVGKAPEQYSSLEEEDWE